MSKRVAFSKFRSYSGVSSSSLYWSRAKREQQKSAPNTKTIEEATDTIVQWAKQYRERMTSNG